jgi:superfamily II DNA or RNA helicase
MTTRDTFPTPADLTSASDDLAALEPDEPDTEPEPLDLIEDREDEDVEDVNPPAAPAPRADDAPLPPVAAREPFALAFAPRLSLTPRSYQSEAVAAWLRAGARGLIELPTGAGKTVVAFDAIARLGVRTLIVVPTIELLRQWRAEVVARLGAPEEHVGIVGGGDRRTGPITVITYDSAALPRRRLAGYGLIVFDEAHHLPAASYRGIVAKAGAPWRLGLSATLQRADGLHADLEALVGPIVYTRSAEELAADRHIAAYKERRIFVDLTPEEEVRYAALLAEWRWYLATHRAMLGGGDLFQALIQRSGYDPAARRALRAHHEARLIALNATAKIAEIERLLQRHASDKVIIFSEYTELVDRISSMLLLPAITYRTAPRERHAILEGFRAGELTKLVTGRVLNEGVDVPDANVAIVASGSASMREYVQRLGRVLRPKPGTAFLYELISRRTHEPGSARRRRPKKPAA